MSDRPVDLVAAAEETVDRVWARLEAESQVGPLADSVDDPDTRADIRESIRSRTKSFRYVLPTQLAAKVADPELDCRSLQKGTDGGRSFDARSLAHKVIVPFDERNNRVLGGSPEPYVNNPLRGAAVTAAQLKDKKDKDGWNRLIRILDRAEASDAAGVETLLVQTFIEIRRLLDETKIDYPAPIRIGLPKTLEVIDEFLAEGSGGDRPMAVTAALFEMMGRRFRLYEKVKREHVNAADASTGLVADLECVDADDNVVLMVEVKDKELSVGGMRDKINSARQRQVAEILFVAQKGIVDVDRDAVSDLAGEAFASGQSVYVTDIRSLASVVLMLMGERGRPEFLREVGRQLDEFRSELRHRQAWLDLLAAC